MDPTIGVHDTSGNAIDHAINGISDVLSRSDQQTSQDKHDDRALVVEPEDVIVDPDLVELKKILELLEQAQHLADNSMGFLTFQ